MGTQDMVGKFYDLIGTLRAYRHAMGILNYDGETAAPPKSVQGRGETLGRLSLLLYEAFITPEVEALLEGLAARESELDLKTARELQLLRKEYRETTCIPKAEYAAYTQLCSDAGGIWRKARQDNDFASFEPYLGRLVETTRRFAGYRKPQMKPYDALLDDYEEGLTVDFLTPYFAALRAELVPLVQAVAVKPAGDCPFLKGGFPVEGQRHLAKGLMDLLGVDKERCALGEAAHPFTMSISKWDSRITTRYDDKDLLSSLYSVIHESGHGLYGLGVDDALQGGQLADGASMGLHESQSRLYENMIGRGLPFQARLLPLLRESFPGRFDEVDERALYQAVNQARPSLIRTEADELTYSMHIMVRFELEKALIEGSLRTADLPAEWARLYKDYLGVTVPDDARGVLQDIHWSGGAFGYFPSYSLGSAYAAQIYAVMGRDLDLEGLIRAGNMGAINAWLGEKVHRHGKLYPPAQVLEMACGQPFDVVHYTRYLKDKFTALYGL